VKPIKVHDLEDLVLANVMKPVKPQVSKFNLKTFRTH